MRPYRLALLLAGLVVILLIIVPLFSASIGLLVDRIWFNHIGFREIFVTILWTQVGLGVCCGAAFLLFAGLNFWVAQGVALRSGYRRAITRTIEIPAIEKLPSFFGRLIWFGLVLAGLDRWSMGGGALGDLSPCDARGAHHADRSALRDQPELLPVPPAFSFLSLPSRADHPGDQPAGGGAAVFHLRRRVGLAARSGHGPQCQPTPDGFGRNILFAVRVARAAGHVRPGVCAKRLGVRRRVHGHSCGLARTLDSARTLHRSRRSLFLPERRRAAYGQQRMRLAAYLGWRSWEDW